MWFVCAVLCCLFVVALCGLMCDVVVVSCMFAFGVFRYVVCWMCVLGVIALVCCIGCLVCVVVVFVRVCALLLAVVVL